MRASLLFEMAGYRFPENLKQYDGEVTGISSDSRKIRKGEVFVALRGLCEDGLRFAEEAMKKGAAFVVGEREVGVGAFLHVENARAALARLYNAWYAFPASALHLIGVTGTNGKTSTSTMLFYILRAAGYNVGLIGTVECRINERVLLPKEKKGLANLTTPDPDELYAMLAQMRAAGVQYVVMEVSSHALAFEKTEPLIFFRAVFTNLTQDHLDFHGDMESYFAEKKKLFSRCRGAVVSASTVYGTRLARGLEVPLYEVSPETVGNIELKGEKGVSFTLSHPVAEPLDLFLPVAGAFSVENGALAALTALSLGVKGETVRAALASFKGVRGRMERLPENPLGVTVFLDYAHTPDALQKLLQAVREAVGKERRILLLFGCGGDRDRSKRREMGRVASRLADFLVLTSDNCRSESPLDILAEILRGVDKEKPHCVVVDRGEAIAYAVSVARRGDVLVLAGKGHEEYEIKGGERLPFSERNLVAECLLRRAKEEGYEN